MQRIPLHILGIVAHALNVITVRYVHGAHEVRTCFGLIVLLHIILIPFTDVLHSGSIVEIVHLAC